jgi:hypothetical protein
MNGFYGCIPDNSSFAKDISEALEIANLIFDGLPKNKLKALRNNHYVDLGPEYGADYIEIARNTEVSYRDLIDSDY